LGATGRVKGQNLRGGTGTEGEKKHLKRTPNSGTKALGGEATRQQLGRGSKWYQDTKKNNEGSRSQNGHDPHVRLNRKKVKKKAKGRQREMLAQRPKWGNKTKKFIYKIRKRENRTADQEPVTLNSRANQKTKKKVAKKKRGRFGAWRAEIHGGIKERGKKVQICGSKAKPLKKKSA